MSIQKKTLISTLKSAKKANLTKNEVSLDHAHSSIKAQPIVKAVAKGNLSNKLVTKAAAKFALAKKTALKS